MTLLHAMSMFSDNTNIIIIKGGNILSFYDGKNSVDECYNELEIDSVSWFSNSNTAYITIKEEK